MKQKVIHIPVAIDMPRDPGGAGPCGDPNVICLANDSRFVQTHFNEPVTAYAIGLPVADVAGDLDFLCPRVPVPRRFSYRDYSNAKELVSETVDDIRAIGGDFKRVEYEGAEVQSKTDNKGLSIVIDLDEVADGEPWQERAVYKLKRRLLINELRRAAALYNAGTASNKTWDTSAGKDPDMDVINDLVAAGTAGGVRPNRVFFGWTAWAKRVASHRAQNLAGGYASAGLSESELAGLYGVSGVRKSTAIYQSTSSAKAEIIGSKVYIFSQTDMPDTEDPSNVKRFVTPVGGDFKVYTQQISAKQFVVSVEHYSKIATVKSSGLYCKTIS